MAAAPRERERKREREGEAGQLDAARLEQTRRGGRLRGASTR